MEWPHKLEQGEWDKFVAPFKTLTVGATHYVQNDFPDALGIGQRSFPRNELLGHIVSRPTDYFYVVGVNYFDTNDGCDNEDIFKIDTRTLEMDNYSPRQFEKDFPAYAGTHWANKDFLRKKEESRGATEEI
ncbi:MAG: hypothetical protein ACRDKI_03860 [Solirubrobacterales bacterium]